MPSTNKTGADKPSSDRKDKLQFLMVTCGFNVYWILAVWGQYRFIYLLVLMLIMSWWFFSVNWRFVLSASLIGIVMDATLYHTGFYLFPDGGFPLWLILMWFGFTSFMWISRKVIQSYSANVLIVLGSVGGMLSYIGGNRLEAVDWPLGWVNTALMVALCWLALSYILLTLLSMFSASQRSS